MFFPLITNVRSTVPTDHKWRTTISSSHQLQKHYYHWPTMQGALFPSTTNVRSPSSYCPSIKGHSSQWAQILETSFPLTTNVSSNLSTDHQCKGLSITDHQCKGHSSHWPVHLMYVDEVIISRVFWDQKGSLRLKKVEKGSSMRKSTNGVEWSNSRLKMCSA